MLSTGTVIHHSCKTGCRQRQSVAVSARLITIFGKLKKMNLPHNLIKDKLVDLIERTFQREGCLYIACNNSNAFFTSDAVRNYNLWSCQKVCEALIFLLDNIYIRLSSKLYRQIVGIPMGTNCAPLVADLFLFCYERDFMLSLSEDNQSGVMEAFNSTSRYLDDLLNIGNNFFDSMVNHIYPSELQLNTVKVSDAKASFLDLHLSISDGFVKLKIYNKRDDFDFDIVNFPFLDSDAPRSASYGVYISQLIRFARVSSHVDDFNTRNKLLTEKNFSNKDIDIINFIGRSQNFIGGILTKCLNIMSD